MSGTAPNSRIEVPYHLRRYVANHQNVPVGHFSVLTEMTPMLIAPMEMAGYTPPEHMVPDISHGRMCNWNSFGIRKMSAWTGRGVFPASAVWFGAGKTAPPGTLQALCKFIPERRLKQVSLSGGRGVPTNYPQMGREHVGRVWSTCPNPLPVVLAEDSWADFRVPYDL
jgi:hypothetical protein